MPQHSDTGSGKAGGYFRSANDGKRFLVQEPEGSQQELPMVVQLNYAARLGK